MDPIERPAQPEIPGTPDSLSRRTFVDAIDTDATHRGLLLAASIPANGPIPTDEAHAKTAEAPALSGVGNEAPPLPAFQRITTKDRDGCTAIRFTEARIGISDAQNDAIAGDFAALIACGRSHIIVDFSGVEYFSSEPIGTLVRLMKAARATGGDIARCSVPRNIEEVFEITRLQRPGLMPAYGSVEDAIAAIAPRRTSADRADGRTP